MKKIAMFLITTMTYGMMLSSCGSSKQTTQNSQNTQWAPPEVEVSKEKCEELAEQKPDVRAYGQGVSRDASRAKQLAESDARAAFVRTLETSVKSAEEAFGSGYTQGNAYDEAGLNNTMRMTIAQGVAKNTVVIGSQRFMRPDGSYRVAVCVEYRGDRKQLASDLAKQIEQQIPDEDRIKIKYDYEKFRERIEEELAKQK